MAGSIKGLTVEIGGDTTKLGKALEGVQKKSKSLSGELGQINRLLKMDPGNTDLLAQKQKVLAEAIANTAEKLDTLKTAEKQVQKQFERGEVSEEQVRALQREIIATEKKMDSYKNAAKETEKALRGVGDESEKTEKASKDLGKTLANVAKTGFAAVIAVAAAAVTGLIAAAEATREYRTEMGKLNAAYTASGHSASTAATAYGLLYGVIGETDQSVEAAQQIALLADSEKEVVAWSELAAGVVGRFGDALQPETFFEAANETLKLGEATGAFTQMLEGCGYDVEAFNKGLAACSTTEERQAYLLKVTRECLGEAGEAYRENNAEIIRANEANNAWMQSMAGIGGAIEPIITDVKMLGASLLADAVPGVQKLAEAFRGLMSGDAGASGDFAAALSGLVTGLVNKITQALPTIATVGMNIISTLATSLLQQIPTLLSVGGQIVSQLLSGIATNLPTIAQSAMNALGGFVQGIQTYLPQVLAKGREILMNLATGIQQNLPNLVSQGLDILMNLANTIYNNAPTLIQTGFDVISKLVSGVVSAIPTLIAKAPEIISKFANVINDNVPMILSRGAQLVIQLVKGIISAIPTLVANIPKIFTAIMDVWSAFNWVNLGKNAMNFLKNGIENMVGAIKGAGTKVLNSLTSALQALPGKLLTLGQNAINFLRNGIASMIGAARGAAGNVLSAVVSAITNLPSRLLSLGKNAITSLGNAISSGVGTLRAKAVSLFNSIVTAAKEIPGKMLQVGKDIISGVIDGIGSMIGALYDTIKNALSGLVDKAKAALGINSPSKVFANTVGIAIPEGIAKGMTDNARIATNAVGNLSNDLVDAAEADVGGLTFERNLKYNARAAALPAALASGYAMADAALLSKLDAIYERLGRLQVVLDSGATVGGLIDDIDASLAVRQALRARGV